MQGEGMVQEGRDKDRDGSKDEKWVRLQYT